MGAPVFVAGYAFSISAGGLFCFVPWLRPSAGMCPRRGTFFWRNPLRGLSCAAKVRCAHGALVLKHSSPKRRQKKATPLSASLRFASGNLRCSRPAGSRSNSLRCTALKQSRALIRWPLRSSAHTEGRGQPNSRTSIRAIALLGPVLRAQAPRAGRSAGWVERSDDPCGCFGVRLSTPCGCACGGAVAGWHARRSARASLTDSPRLSERSASARSEFRSAPRNRPDAGLPRSAAQGSQTWGRPFFGDFLWAGHPVAKRKKVTALPGALPGSRPQHRHATRPANKPRLRQAQPERARGGLRCCPGFDRLSPSGWGVTLALASTSSARTAGQRTGVAPQLRPAQPERAGVLHSETINFIAACAYSTGARAQKHLKTQRPAP